jgi:molybdopterin converting factor small subunit
VLADKESLEQTITTLETTVQSLNDKLEEAKERERLIVEYPDINGPVNPDLSGMKYFIKKYTCVCEWLIGELLQLSNVQCMIFF